MSNTTQTDSTKLAVDLAVAQMNLERTNALVADARDAIAKAQGLLDLAITAQVEATEELRAATDAATA